MSQDSASTAARYFTAWQGKDFDTLRSVLADNATFRGPLGTADSGEECLAGLKGMAPMLTDIDLQKVFVDGDDVLTWFELHTGKVSPMPTASWMHVQDGKIDRIRITFDPRELLAEQ